MAVINITTTSRTETAINISYQCDESITYIWYSVNGGTAWVGVDVADGKSGGFTIVGLAPGSTYNIAARARTNAESDTIESAPITASTFNYPYCVSAPAFTIGDRVTLGLYNPLSRAVSVALIAADGRTVGSIATTGTSVTGFDDIDAVEILNNSIPTSQSGLYAVAVTFGGIADARASGVYFASGAISPRIGQITYADENSTTAAITGDSAQIIRNQSTVGFTAANISTTGGATISAAELEVNGVTYQMTVSDAVATVSGITIDSAADVSAVVTVTDSRGLSGSAAVTVHMIDWVAPTLTNELARQSNYYSSTDLTVNARFSPVGGHNSAAIRYRYKEKNAATWGSYASITDGSTTTLTLDNAKAWDVQTEIADLFATTTYNLSVPVGMPLMFFDTLLHSVGINCFPTHPNSLEVNGVVVN